MGYNLSWIIYWQLGESELAKTMHELEAGKEDLAEDPERLGVLFKEMIQMCLWSVSPRQKSSNI